MSLYEKMVNEAVGATRATLGVIKANRGGTFKVTDAKPYVDAVNKMKAADGQSEEVIALHVDSVNTHFDILSGLTNTVRPEDEPFTEQCQTAPILEILYEEDDAFKSSMWKFIDAIEAERALVGLEAVRRYGGMYGPTSAVDFGMLPGSTAHFVNQILVGMDIPDDHKKTILASKSFGTNTSYGFGGALRSEIESGKTLADAEQAEIEMLQFIYREPTVAQSQIMETHNLGGHGGYTSFDMRDYMAQYKARMRPTIVRAMEEGVHYANITSVPADCVGDVAHHIAQSAYNMFNDGMVFAIYEAVTDGLENTLRRGLKEDAYETVNDVLTVATGATACAAAYLLWKDSFTVPMVIDLLCKRFANYCAMHPDRGGGEETHNVDLMDILRRGEGILDVPPIGAGGKVKGVEVDLSPIDESEVIANPQRHTYPGCAITQRFAALMTLADFPCFLTPECTSASLMTNIIATRPDQAYGPWRSCKNCGSCTLIKRNVPLATGRGSGAYGYCQWNVAV